MRKGRSFRSVPFRYFFKSFLKYASYSSSVSLRMGFFFAISRLEGSMGVFSPFYSVRSAMTGSFFAADCAGMSPEMSVKTTLTHTMMNAVETGSVAMPAMPVRF